MAQTTRGKALVAKLHAQAGVRDPEALAAYLGRFKKARKAGKSVAEAKTVAKGLSKDSGSKKTTSDEPPPYKATAEKWASEGVAKGVKLLDDSDLWGWEDTAIDKGPFTVSGWLGDDDVLSRARAPFPEARGKKTSNILNTRDDFSEIGFRVPLDSKKSDEQRSAEYEALVKQWNTHLVKSLKYVDDDAAEKAWLRWKQKKQKK